MTDEDFIKTYMENGASATGVAAVTGLSKQAVQQRAQRLQARGVKLPATTNPLGRPIVYTSERVQRLNELVQSYDSKQER